MEEGVAPTDSRRRPDQRLMENGQWDEANTEKVCFISGSGAIDYGKIFPKIPIFGGKVSYVILSIGP